MLTIFPYSTSSYGKIFRVSDNIIDVKFEGELPPLLHALKVCGHPTQLEVAQYLGGGVVRTVPMSPTKGIVEGVRVEDTGDSIQVPVGEGTLGRMLNVLGEPIDDMGILQHTEVMSMFRKFYCPLVDETASIFSEGIDTTSLIIYTGIKAIDLLAPVKKNGTISLVGNHEEKAKLMRELINNTGGFSVYAGVGEKQNCNQMSNKIEKGGGIKRKCALVYSHLEEPVGSRARVAFAGLAIAEHFRDKGNKTFLFIDNTRNIVKAYLELQNVLGRVSSSFTTDYTETLTSDFDYIRRRVASIGIRQRENPVPGSLTSFFFVDGISSATFDGTLVVTQERNEQETCPIIDYILSSSHILSKHTLERQHFRVARKVLRLIENYYSILEIAKKSGAEKLFAEDEVIFSRARKVLMFLKQPSGKYVSLEENLSAFEGLVDGRYDDYPEEVFDMVGGIEDTEVKMAKIKKG